MRKPSGTLPFFSSVRFSAFRTRVRALHGAVLPALLIAAFLSNTVPTWCQANNPNTESGLTPYETYQGGDLDKVSLSTGNLNVAIPLVSYPQRGKLALSFSLRSTNKGWRIYHSPSCVTAGCFYWTDGLAAPGAVNLLNTIVTPVEDHMLGQAWAYSPCAKGAGGALLFQPPFIETADGAVHYEVFTSTLVANEFNICATGNNDPFTLETVDGTAFQYQGMSKSGTPSGVMIDAQGTRYTGSASGPTGPLSLEVEDVNGNEISLVTTTVATSGDEVTEVDEYYTDSLGRKIPYPPQIVVGLTNIEDPSTSNYSGCTGSLPTTSAVLWTPPGPGGANVTFKFCYATLAVQTNFQVSGVTETSFSESVLQNVVLPNGTAWTFGYNGYSDLTEIGFPTGGSITYSYGTVQFYPTSECSILNCTPYSRAVESRALNANDGTGSHTWTYSWGTPTGTPPNQFMTNTMTDPLGNQTVFKNQALDTFREVQRQIYQGPQAAGALLETISTSWFTTGSDYELASVFPSQVTTTWANGQTKMVQKTWDTGVTGGTSYGDLLSESDYDYGPGAPGALLRTTTYNYLALSNSTYAQNNLVRLPSQTADFNGASSTGACGAISAQACTAFAYDGSALSTSGITTQRASTPPDGLYPGNQTSISRWLNTTGAMLTSTATYFDTGEVQVTKDPKNNPTTYAYSPTYAGAYPTSITNALNQTTTKTYDFNTGLLASTTDPNGQTTSITYDTTWRLATASYPDGGLDTITHQEVSIPFTATLTKKITSSLNYVKTNVFDGVGRISQSQLTSDPSGTDYTVTAYDADGRIASVTNPYRTTSDPTYGVTSYRYDALNRTLLVTEPDGSKITTVYLGNSTTVTDEAGKTRESFVDGAGRMEEVIENPGGLGYVTTYGHDALDDLTSVVQGGSRTRTFIYDSLKRLTSSLNPETGTTPVLYSYDANSNVVTKKDARAITITYSWDALNRMLGRSYSNGDSSVGYGYDSTASVVVASCHNIGHMTSMTDPAGTEGFCYDTIGRLWGDQRTTAGITKNTSYVYNLDGSLATLNYPSGHSVSYTVNGASLPVTAADSTVPNYVQSVTYMPWGALSGALMGVKISEQLTYNTRLQPSSNYASYSIPCPPTGCEGLLTPATALPAAGLPEVVPLINLTYNFNVGAGDNGNLIGVTNGLNSNRSQAYGYDNLNRITTAATLSTCSANCWSLSFGLDEWANLTSVTGTGNATLTPNANNQISVAPFTFDASGNELTDATFTYTWNAESQMKAGGGVAYLYDGRGNRVEKSGTKLYWYGPSGEVLDETDTTGSIANTTFSEYIYFAGARVARRDYQNNQYYYFEDQVKSSRVIAEIPEGTTTVTTCYNADFYPYGGETDFVNTCAQNYKFGGKERDPETGNDYFGARFYSSAYGRFLSADWSSVPAPVPYANLGNPQTLNLYAFVSDNPESFADLDGHSGGDGRPAIWFPDPSMPELGVINGRIHNFANDEPGAIVDIPVESGHKTVKLGGIPVDIKWTTMLRTQTDQNGNITATLSRGVEIIGQPDGCDNCRWAQTVSGTGFKGTQADTELGADPKQQPFTVSTEHPGELWDYPKRSEVPANLSFVSTAGVPGGKVFYILGSITWGFHVSANGSLIFNGTRLATADEQARSLGVWRGATGWLTSP